MPTLQKMPAATPPGCAAYPMGQGQHKANNEPRSAQYQPRFDADRASIARGDTAAIFLRVPFYRSHKHAPPLNTLSKLVMSATSGKSVSLLKSMSVLQGGSVGAWPEQTPPEKTVRKSAMSCTSGSRPS